MLHAFQKLPDIIVLTETWFNEGNISHNFLEEWESFHTMRQNGRGGGVSVFVREDRSAKKLDHLSICTDTIESCVVKCHLNTDVIIFAVYRPHTDSIENFYCKLHEMMRDDALSKKDIFLIGDINIDLMLQNNNDSISDFVNSMRSAHFLPTITKPTRFSPNGRDKPSCLDHIWVNNLNRYISGIVIIDLTDHCPAFYSVATERNASESVEVQFRSHKPEYYSKFVDIVTNFEYRIGSVHDVNRDTENFCNAVDDAYCRSFPLKKKYISGKRLQKPWLSSGILKSIKTKAIYFKLHKLGLISTEANRKYKNVLTTVIRNAKIQYYQRAFTNNRNDLRHTWRLVKGLMGQKNCKSRNIASISVDNHSITGGSDIASHFNNYYSRIAGNLDALVVPSNTSPLQYINVNLACSFYLFPVTNRECLDIIGKLKNTKYDINTIPVKLFKKIAPMLSESIVQLINNSFSAGVFPDCLKLARITPVYKSDDRLAMHNYRPISVLPLLSKIFERCVSTRLINFLNKHRLISTCQFGFRQGRCTTDAIEILTEFIYSSLNAKRHTISLFIDFSKAFDTVNHKILLNKLSSHGVRGLPNAWFASYLSNRQHCVKIGHHVSDYKTTNIGVPQGSILGPLLFLCYVNELSNVCPVSTTVLYADDTTFLMSHASNTELVSAINVELQNFANWAAANRLSLNYDKSIAITFTNRVVDTFPRVKLNLGHKELEYEASTKFLGVRIDENLKFHIHINHICKKISKTVGILYRIRTYVTESILIQLYYSLVYPYLIYCNEIWGGAADVHLEKLLLLQKRIVRIITGEQYLAHTAPLFHRTGILKIKDLHTYLLAIRSYKEYSVHNIRQPDHSYQTRNRNNAIPQFQRLTLAQNSIYFAGPVVWNSLPAAIRTIESIRNFKRSVKEWLLEGYGR